jgi:hypothetical protein
MVDTAPVRQRRQVTRTGWRCQLRVRVPEGLAGSGELELFRKHIEIAAAVRGMTPVSVTAVAADRCVSVLVESASTVAELTDAVTQVERLVRAVAKDVWPEAGEGDVQPDSVAARRL